MKITLGPSAELGIHVHVHVRRAGPPSDPWDSWKPCAREPERMRCFVWIERTHRPQHVISCELPCDEGSLGQERRGGRGRLARWSLRTPTTDVPLPSLCAAVPHYTFSVRKITNEQESGLEIAYTRTLCTQIKFSACPSQKGRRLAPCGQTSDPAFDSPMRQSIEMSAERPE